MGDGGAIAQFHNAETGALIAATKRGGCAQQVTPISADWTKPELNDTSWPHALEYSARAARPKGGYDRVEWERAAKPIWGPDLERDNIVLCRLMVC